MICWADITLPSSRVRSAALLTYLLSSALLGRSVMGTVSDSAGLVFFALGRAGSDAATGAWAEGAKDINTGAGAAARAGLGAERLPAGWLAAAAIRAANSLESRFFFMTKTFAVMLRWHGITIPRLRNIATPGSHKCATSQHFAAQALQLCDTAIVQRRDSPVAWHRGASALQCLGILPLRWHGITML
jgi:hypothetical protein